MDGRTVRGNQKEQIFGIGTSCIHGRFVQGEIWCKILRLASGEIPYVYFTEKCCWMVFWFSGSDL